ncbi:MAG TPA: transcription-repair coupling factor [Anaerolineaceae bacterium]|nr:transcription-repair coupling factor [Anaerolineaceae bacterium]
MLEELKSLPEFKSLVTDLRERKTIPGLALPRSARLPVLASLQAELGVPILLLTTRADHTLTLFDELKFWDPKIVGMVFPEPNPLFYEQAAWGSTTRRDRLNVLTSLAVYHLPGVQKPANPPVIIAPVRAVMARTLPRRDFIKSSRLIKIGQVVKPEELQRTWVDIGYQANDLVVEPGQFSRRGGILDVWAMAEPQPARLEFFGDEIDTLRRFDPASQRTIQNLDHLLITPAREVLQSKALNLELPVQDVGEFYLPLVHPAVASILDYLPAQALVMVDDLDLLRVTANEIEEQAVRLRLDSIAEGTLAADFPIPYISWSELQDNLMGHTWLELGWSTAEDESALGSLFSSGPRFGGRMKQVLDYMLERCQVGDRLTVVSRQVSRLSELWQEHRGPDNALCEPDFRDSLLSEGWILNLPEKKWDLLTDSEIFGWERPKPRQQHRPAVEAPETLYADLKPGDWVVHIDYGIGRYLGLVRRTLDGVEREFLCVEYEGGDQVYVPVHQADRLSRYIGPDADEPSATRLGTGEWSQNKQKVREAVLEIAQELLELYARRQVAKGFAFSNDSSWQQELEASFPYIETNDQLQAIKEVKKDMESLRPMDRLLCGDVGYGKTEVALRAAFKAIMDGKQVAILVPTTVLAQQHYETFRQRLAPFPAVVEMLSRFRTPREQDEILKLLRSGTVDIVIGTHRLLQQDVLFKDLGLVIIDEEQRFGVTHKEHFKKLRTEVDVLTLTATPIPRTLYMALTGVRDISTINTPPEERLPIITHIGPYSPRLVRQAVLREVERGGQIFFVHNRVQTIRAMERHLHTLVPEARIGVAHGQMPENELSTVMLKFTHGDIDILLCTSIIESGLDIPNANTLILDRGDTFGLAQLYQLRGRVGRGAQRAYAYFFRHRAKPPTPEGQERLEVIAENTQLGAGYSIAMRDLEMRGAGELLGTRQHGFIAAVGFQLYTRMLAQAVRQLRRLSGMSSPSEALAEMREVSAPVSVDLPLGLGIPMGYVPDQGMRLRLYRRLADLKDEGELTALSDEFSDRFGPLPEEVKNLIFQMQVKLRAEEAGLASVSVENDQIVLRYPPLPEGAPGRNLPSIGTEARTGKNAYWMPMGSGDGWKDRLLECLAKINEMTQVVVK